jgi:hypothetical protein
MQQYSARGIPKNTVYRILTKNDYNRLSILRANATEDTSSRKLHGVPAGTISAENRHSTANARLSSIHEITLPFDVYSALLSVKNFAYKQHDINFVACLGLKCWINQKKKELGLSA